MAKKHRIELTIAGITLLGGDKKRSSAFPIFACTTARKKGIRLVGKTTKSAKKTIKKTVRNLKDSPVGRAASSLLIEKKRNKKIYRAKKTAAKLYRGFAKAYAKSKKQFKRASRARIKKMAKYWRRHGGKYVSKKGIVKLMKATKLKKLPRAKKIKRYVAKTLKKLG